MSEQARHILAANIRKLLAQRRWSEAELARRCGVSQKAVNNTANATVSTQIDTVDAIARAFGATTWQLLHPKFEGDLPAGIDVDDLLRNFTSSNEQGRAWILRVAEQEAKYKHGKTESAEPKKEE